jgi:hypothetical protein
MGTFFCQKPPEEVSGLSILIATVGQILFAQGVEKQTPRNVK